MEMVSGKHCLATSVCLDVDWLLVGNVANAVSRCATLQTTAVQGIKGKQESTGCTWARRFLLRITALVTEASGNLARIKAKSISEKPVGGLVHQGSRRPGVPAGQS